jgi:hypothetical protein
MKTATERVIKDYASAKDTLENTQEILRRLEIIYTRQEIMDSKLSEILQNLTNLEKWTRI